MLSYCFQVLAPELQLLKCKCKIYEHSFSPYINLQLSFVFPQVKLTQGKKSDLLETTVLRGSTIYGIFPKLYSVADPDLQLRRGPGYNLLPQSAFLPPVISSFYIQTKKGPPPPATPLDPTLVLELLCY